MDFRPKMNYYLPSGVPLPFFMAYPEYSRTNGEAQPLQDFEYLRRTYPAMVGRYQRRVEEILDTMDYEGSMIYDEYPDKISLMELGNSVAKILARMDGITPKNAEEAAKLKLENTAAMEKASLKKAKEPEEGRLQGMSGMEEAYLQGLSQVLVCNEIYRRRQKKRRGQSELN